MGYDNYFTLITVPATDGNFTAALGYASIGELIRAEFYMENHPEGNKTRLAAVNREIKRRRNGGRRRQKNDAAESNEDKPI